MIKEYNMSNKNEILDEMNKKLNKKDRQEEHRCVIEFLVRDYKEKNYNMTVLKARLEKYFALA